MFIRHTLTKIRHISLTYYFIDFRWFYSIRYLGRHCCLKVNLRWQMIVMRLRGEVLSLTFKSQLFFIKGHHVEPKEKLLTMSSFYPDNICLTFSGFEPVTPRTRGDHTIETLFLTMLHQWFILVRNWEKAVLFSFRPRNVVL